jgi:ketosteroid isomerase-like protein
MSESTNPALKVVENLLTSIRERNLQGILNSYEQSDDLYVFLEGPRWSSRTYTSVSTGWTAWFNASLEITGHEWLEGPAEITVGDLTTLQGIMNMHTHTPAQTKILKIRGTWVMRRGEDGQWRIVHEHVSAPMEDPYGTGDWK